MSFKFNQFVIIYVAIALLAIAVVFDVTFLGVVALVMLAILGFMSLVIVFAAKLVFRSAAKNGTLEPVFDANGDFVEIRAKKNFK